MNPLELTHLGFNSHGEEEIDEMFDLLDDYLLSGDFASCDEYISTIDVDSMQSKMLIGVLTVTNAWKHELQTRDAFYLKVADNLRKQYTHEEVARMLEGLE